MRNLSVILRPSLALVLYTVLSSLSCSCTSSVEDPWTLCECKVTANFIKGSSKGAAADATITMTDSNLGSSYTLTTSQDGSVTFKLRAGVYRIMAEYGDYSASTDGVKVLERQTEAGIDIDCNVHLADICIKEVYCGGCMKLPQEGSYHTDSYIILHNNSSSVQYLDSLCFGTLDPYNGHATNIWPTDIDYAPVIQAVWQFPGSGTDYPLASGEDAVVAIYGAIDHSATYPLSVNLDKKGYFVCYSPAMFPNTTYHPAPGSNIEEDHWLKVAIKVGKANAYTFSQSSPALIIFKTHGMTFNEFVSRSGAVIPKPNSDDNIVCVPDEWIEDGVEIFSGQYSYSRKRLHSTVDSGNATLTATSTGKTVMRFVNDEKTAAAGYEVLRDSNNSTRDFYETEQQSLWRESGNE